MKVTTPAIRGSALECPAIHDGLLVSNAIDPDENITGKSQLRRIVAMLAKLTARNDSIAEPPSLYLAAFEHEHEQEQEQK